MHGSLSLCFSVVLFCVGRGLCDRQITRPKKSYRVCQLKITKLEMRRSSSDLGCNAIKRINNVLASMVALQESNVVCELMIASREEY
jgi:hypothetical protein